MIIVEGMDATGKTTLINELVEKTGWPVHKSGGPEKYPGEILERCAKFIELPNQVICDRYPAISQAVYSTINGRTSIPENILIKLSERKPLIIYSSGTNRGKHQIKEDEEPEYVKLVEDNRDKAEQQYLLLMAKYFSPTYLVYQWQFREAIVNYAVNYAKANGGLLV